MVLTACVCLGLAGCEMFNRRPAGNTFAPGSGGGTAEPAKRADPGDPITGMGGPGGTPGFLAGRVINDRTGQPTRGYVRWKCVDDPKEKMDPIDVPVGPDGYFTIQGLKMGKMYQVEARTEEGGKIVMAGVTYKQAPAFNLLIKVREDLVTSITPGVPPEPAYIPKHQPPKKDAEAKKDAAFGPERPASAQEPAWGPGVPQVQIQVQPVDGSRPAASIKQPQDQQWVAPDAGKPPATTDPSRIAVKDGVKWPPQVNIKPKPAPPPPPPEPPKSWGTPSLQSRLDATPVPSCVVVGKQLVNFALTDLEGAPWVYKERKRGKVVLLDFWGTRCSHCLKGMPELAALQKRYGAAGLDVIGIACEGSGSPKEQAQRVAAAAQKWGGTYQQLLAAGPQCPVMRDFQVNMLPTLVLVEGNGWIEWKKTGAPTEQEMQTLERRIQICLGVS
jgi:thiol-disulfide isomerase/thioredoxin